MSIIEVYEMQLTWLLNFQELLEETNNENIEFAKSAVEIRLEAIKEIIEFHKLKKAFKGGE